MVGRKTPGVSRTIFRYSSVMAEPEHTDAVSSNIPQPPTMSSKDYARLGLILLGVTVFLLMGFVTTAKWLSELGLLDKFYYILLIVAALVVSVITFGAMRSYATFSGRQLNGQLELGGSFLAAIIIILIGIWVVPSDPFGMTVRVFLNGKRIKSGRISVDLNADHREKSIDRDGEVHFIGIPKELWHQKVRFDLEEAECEIARGKNEYETKSVVEISCEKSAEQLPASRPEKAIADNRPSSVPKLETPALTTASPNNAVPEKKAEDNPRSPVPSATRPMDELKSKMVDLLKTSQSNVDEGTTGEIGAWNGTGDTYQSTTSAKAVEVVGEREGFVRIPYDCNVLHKHFIGTVQTMPSNDPHPATFTAKYSIDQSYTLHITSIAVEGDQARSCGASIRKRLEAANGSRL